jgi:predicted DNA-binding protein with PD1-like motif
MMRSLALALTLELTLKLTLKLALALILATALTSGAYAKDVAPPFEYATQDSIPTGTAPGLKATELSPKTRTFHLVFAKGDDLRAGLAEFAAKNHLTNAHFTAIGALDLAVIGWSDRPKKAFKIERLDEEMEVTSLSGNIVRGTDGNPVVHAHCVVALLRNGTVHAGHLLQGRVSLTMQMYLTDSEPLTAAATATH